MGWEPGFDGTGAKTDGARRTGSVCHSAPRARAVVQPGDMVDTRPTNWSTHSDAKAGQRWNSQAAFDTRKPRVVAGNQDAGESGVDLSTMESQRMTAGLSHSTIFLVTTFEARGNDNAVGGRH